MTVRPHRLAALVDGLGVVDPADADVEVVAVTADHRKVGPGSVFVAVQGVRLDGTSFARAAVEAGAVAVVSDRRIAGLGVPQLTTDQPRRTLAHLVSRLHDDPSASLDVVGVTGTDGKTTTCSMVAAILTEAGRAPGLITTVTNAQLPETTGDPRPPSTPDATVIQAALADYRDRGSTAAVVEVSAHALSQYRVDGISFAVSVFTNLAQDHLDHFGTIERYFDAKARLFSPELCRRAVVNRDDTHGLLLAKVAEVPTETYGMADAEGLTLATDHSRFRWRGIDVEVGLPGRHNVSNALAAATAAAAIGIGSGHIAAGLASLRWLRGRMEPVVAGQAFSVFVDYAHTPGGLSEVLGSLRDGLTDGRLIVVFGCGGDKDVHKRPLMGAAAAEAADVVVVTSDNPRSESPDAIIADVMAGISRRDGVFVEPDRRAAIALALANARLGDVVVLAGKGHETTQEIGGRLLPFDDAEVAAELLQEGTRS